jgi:transposase-like protein
MGWRIQVEDGNLYLRLRKMSHTIYAPKFEQTIIHQHVHLLLISQLHTSAHVLMRLYPIDKSLVCLQSERMLELYIIYTNHRSSMK